MGYETIKYSQDPNGVVELVLNRPEKYNAINHLMFWELNKAFQQMARDSSVRCCLLTGAGDRAFCSGADFWGSQELTETLSVADKAEFDQMGQEFFEVFGTRSDGDLMRMVYRLACDMYDFEKPVVCAVNGMALGVGWCFAQNADFIYAAEDARLCYLFVRNAFGTTDMGTSFFVPRSLGMPKAKELMMLGEDFTGKQAEDLGLINRALPRSEVLVEARRIAQRLAAGPPAALKSMKKTLNVQVRDDIMQSIRLEVKAAMETMSGTEFKEAIASRGQKKEPFPGFSA